MQTDLSRQVGSVCVFYIFSQYIFGSPVGHNITIQSYDVHYEIGNKPVDCETASSECMHGGFELARKQNTDTWIGFAQAISPTLLPNMRVWIDHTVEYTPWLSEKGCYENLRHFASIVYRPNLGKNNRGSCSRQCIGFTYLSLKEKECSCWNTLRTFNRVDRNMCNTSCPGEKNQMCGGNKVNSIFRIENNLRLEDEEGLCMTYERSYSLKKTKQTWRSAPCWMLHHFICEDLTVDGPCIIPPYKANWTVAASSCADNYNGSLVRDEENDAKLDFKMKNATTYWVGKFRDVSIKRGQGRKCLTFVRGSNEWINTEEKDCTEKYRPLCQKVVPVVSSTYIKADDVPIISSTYNNADDGYTTTTESTLNYYTPLKKRLLISQSVNYVLVAVFVIAVFAVPIIVRRCNKKARVRCDQTYMQLLNNDREESKQLGSTCGREKCDQTYMQLLNNDREESKQLGSTCGREKFDQTDSPLLENEREGSPKLGSSRGEEKFDQTDSQLLKKDKEESPQQVATYGREKFSEFSQHAGTGGKMFPKADREGQTVRQRMDINKTV